MNNQIEFVCGLSLKQGLKASEKLKADFFRVRWKLKVKGQKEVNS